MKKKWVLLTLCLSMAGCDALDTTALQVGPAKISQNEFEKAYQSSYHSQNSSLTRKDFLDDYITKKVILLEAEEMGLSEDPEFLNDLQVFWEQSLMKRTLKYHTDAAQHSVHVGEQEVRDYFEKHILTALRGRSYNDAREQIRVILFKQKQAEELTAWIESLRAKADVQFDENMLGIKE